MSERTQRNIQESLNCNLQAFWGHCPHSGCPCFGYVSVTMLQWVRQNRRAVPLNQQRCKRLLWEFSHSDYIKRGGSLMENNSSGHTVRWAVENRVREGCSLGQTPRDHWMLYNWNSVMSKPECTTGVGIENLPLKDQCFREQPLVHRAKRGYQHCYICSLGYSFLLGLLSVLLLKKRSLWYVLQPSL